MKSTIGHINFNIYMLLHSVYTSHNPSICKKSLSSPHMPTKYLPLQNIQCLSKSYFSLLSPFSFPAKSIHDDWVLDLFSHTKLEQQCDPLFRKANGDAWTFSSPQNLTIVFLFNETVSTSNIITILVEIEK